MRRIASNTLRGRQLTHAFRSAGHRSKWMPHIGAKEQERALRCFMQLTFCTWETFHVPHHPRSAPIMCQLAPNVYPFPMVCP